jgi:HSP20 family molecular chaperone IbpA
MIEEETTKHHWLRIGAIALITFITTFLAFYIVMEIMFNRITNPAYQVKQVEKLIAKQERNFHRFEQSLMENPFEPKMRPMMVNLVKEPSEYKIIVDLEQLDGDEKAVNVVINGDELTIKGQLDKKIRNSEKIINFMQTYYLDEKLEEDKIVKERKGNKYIVTIPFVSKDNDD